MIFDNAAITKLVKEWKSTRDVEILADIQHKSTSLIEAVVSSFPSYLREDLIQEAYIRLQYSLPQFDEQRGNLYSYLSSVIRNACITFLKKESRQAGVAVDLELFQLEADEEGTVPESVLQSLIVANRQRFPSIPTPTIDELTCKVYGYIQHSTKGKSRGAIAKLIKEFHLSRTIVTVVYHSSLIYLRTYFMNRDIEPAYIEEPEELSIAKDLQELLGRDAYVKIATIFSGMYVKFP